MQQSLDDIADHEKNIVLILEHEVRFASPFESLICEWIETNLKDEICGDHHLRVPDKVLLPSTVLRSVAQIFVMFIKITKFSSKHY